MIEQQPFTLTPDFDHWPSSPGIANIKASDGALEITWCDGKASSHHALWLAENDPAPEVLHPRSRETLLSPLDFPSDLKVKDVTIINGNSVQVVWSHNLPDSYFDIAWLYGNAYFEKDKMDGGQCVLWNRETQPTPPSFEGQAALNSPEIMLEWLEALRDYGVARLTGLENKDGLLMEVVESIGVIRASNFGQMYTLEIKDDPDSNAFTSDALLQHIDMPTRECPHGLQFLFCRENTTSGGEGIYVDGYRIAEDLKSEDPESYQTLCEIEWEYNNRSKSSSYRASGPVIERDHKGQTTGIRYNTWLRAPLKASLVDQDRAYRSYRAFTERAQDLKYQMIFKYRPGDLLAFDNRRALHGRKGYDAKGGTRFIEGIYSDRDDMHSAIRTLRRKIAQQKHQ